jgi:hypothetical protein
MIVTAPRTSGPGRSSPASCQPALPYLLITGIVVFLGALLLGALRMWQRPGRYPAR